MANAHPNRPRRVGRARRALVAAAGLSLLLAACGGGASSEEGDAEPSTGGELTIGTANVWNYIDPLRSVSETEITIGTAVYDRLFVPGENGEVEPSLVEEYELSDDELTLTLHLEEDVTFHDGTPFDSEAVRLNIERVADPENGCYCVTRFDTIESIETPDDLTVVLNLSQPDGSLLSGALASSHAQIVSPAALEEHGNEVGQEPIGTGPFRYVNQTPGAELTIERSEDYWQEEPAYLDRITFQAMTDADARFSSLQSGAIDVAELLQPGHVQQADGDERIDVETIPGYGTTFVQMNVSQPPFDDPEARRAVCAAINRDGINEALNYGLSETNVDSPYPPAHDYFPGELANAVEHDPAAAEQAVADMGGLEFTLSVGQQGVRQAEALQEQWNEVGMDVEVEPLEITSLTRLSNDLLYDAMFVNMFGEADPDIVPRALFKSDQPGNVTGLADDEVDELIEEGRRATDPEERATIYTDLSERLAELTPHCYVWATNYYLGTSPETHDVRQNSRGVMWLADAYVEGQ